MIICPVSGSLLGIRITAVNRMDMVFAMREFATVFLSSYQ